MRILLVSGSYDSLTQRAQVELADRGHAVLVVIAVSDETVRQAVLSHDPALIVGLSAAVPAGISSARPCVLIHPGPVGDRGPSALDWAIMTGAGRWGVTVVRATADPGAGDVWASAEFALPRAPKDAVYRTEVADAAMTALRLAITRFRDGRFAPQPVDYRGHEVTGKPHGPVRQRDRHIDWHADPTWLVLAKLRAADSTPGVLDVIDGGEYFLIGGHDEDALRGAPGSILATRDGAICRATVDGAVWIPELRRRPGPGDPDTVPLPAATALPPGSLAGSQERPAPLMLSADRRTYQPIRYSETRTVGYLEFSFPGGAMTTAQCIRLLRAYQYAATRPARVIVLGSARDVFCAGIHSGAVETAPDPAAAERQNLAAVADLIEAVLATTGKLTVAALAGDAGAAGLLLARAADEVWCREGALLHPYDGPADGQGARHPSEPIRHRLGPGGARGLMTAYLPFSAAYANRCGLVDRLIIGGTTDFREQVENLAAMLATSPDYGVRIAAKARQRANTGSAELAESDLDASLVTR